MQKKLIALAVAAGFASASFAQGASAPAPTTAPARAVTITEATFSDGTSAITLPRAVEDRVDD